MVHALEEPTPEPVDPFDLDAVRRRAFELSQGPEAGPPEANWLRAEHELTVAHEYDTADRDLERVGVTLARLPAEAGVVWRLSLPRGERVEAWEPGNRGLQPPAVIAGLIEQVAAGKPLVPAPPLSDDPGAVRLRDMLRAQRDAMLAHDPGIRLGLEPENLHQHRVAARRARAFLRAARTYVDAEWRRALAEALAELGSVTGPVRDLDVLRDHVVDELQSLEGEQAGSAVLLAALERHHAQARERLNAALASDAYRRLLTRLRLPPRLADGVVAIPLEKLARKDLRRLRTAVDRLGEQPAEGDVHRLRILLKRVRYVSELAEPDDKASRRFRTDAASLQTLLGEHQDALVAEERLRDAAVGDAATAAAFVAGRLAERQRVRRERVRAELPDAWRRLRKSGSRLGR